MLVMIWGLVRKDDEDGKVIMVGDERKRLCGCNEKMVMIMMRNEWC